MIKMYKVSIWGDLIKGFNVVKLTDKSVWFIDGLNKEQRELLLTESHAWFKTEIEAFEWKKSKLEFDVQLKQSHLDFAKQKLDRFLNVNKL